MSELSLYNIFNKKSINDRAKEHWDYKDKRSRLKSSHKYRHIFKNKNVLLCSWDGMFDELSKPQQSLLIKSELIRTYDGLPNIDKTELKNRFKLSMFASKWYKLSSSDKSKLLKFVL